MADATAHRLQLADVLAEEPFGLELLTGGPDAGGRAVRGAHAVEVEAPERWLAKDWIMLTTGVRLRGNPDAQRALVPQLTGGGASALGFGVGLGFDRVPPALVDAADEHAFPVFAVPYETPFREIIHFVDSVLTSGEEHVFRRLTALQRYLVDALRTAHPERAVVDRLSRFLDASVVVMGEDGDPATVAGRPPPRELLAEVAAQPAGLLELDAGGWHAVAVPVITRADQAERWLLLASRRLSFVGKLARPAAEATAPLLAAMASLGDVVREQEQAVKAALLAEALDPAPARDPLPIAARAAAFGLDFTQPARVVVVRGGDGARVERALVAQLELAHVAYLTQRRDAGLSALVQGGDERAGVALAAVADAFPDVVMGVGRAVATMGEAHHSLRDAELAADRAAPAGRPIVRFEDLDVATFVVAEIAPERLRPKLEEIHAVLRANPPLHEALAAYFEHDLDIGATAEALHMHRNSLRYRLARFEHLLGRSLKQPATIAAVHIALVAERGAGRTTGDTH